MSMRSKGYEVVDAKAECEDEYREKSRRKSRIMGYGDSYYAMESGDEIEGFIPRNNVRDRL